MSDDRTLDLAVRAATEGLNDLERHELLTEDPTLALEMEDAAAVLHLALTSGAAAPPEGLEQRLMSGLQRAMDASDAPVPAPAPRPGAAPAGGGSDRVLWTGWLAAAAAVVVAVILAGRGDAPAALGPLASAVASLGAADDAIVAAWTESTHERATALTGEVAWSDSANAGTMTFRGLAPNDPSVDQYQLWIFRTTDLASEPHPVDGGVFDVSASGEVVVPIDAKLEVGTGSVFVVTLEKPGGVVVSDRSEIVAVAARG